MGRSSEYIPVGLVEISTRKGEETRVLTRTLGDPNTGTEPARLHSSDGSPSPDSSPERPPLTTDEASDVTLRPTRLELPKPRDFAVEEAQVDTEQAAPTSIVLQTPGSSSSASHILASPTSSIPNTTFDGGLRVLVVDDDMLTRKLMSRMLSRLGCKVTTAENGEIALDLILNGGSRPTPSSEDTGSNGLIPDNGSRSGGEERVYHVIFLDNQMPVMSGLEAVAKLRRLGRKDLVVGVTGTYVFFGSSNVGVDDIFPGNALLSDQQEYLDAGVDQ